MGNGYDNNNGNNTNKNLTPMGVPSENARN